MKRKIFSTLLFGALAFVSLSTVTSCKDYDDDINNLQSQIDALSKKIDDINTQITNGAILTSVTPTANGLTIALSNGKTYDITNGNDGKDGTAWSISEDGYWVKDGNKTEYKAVPKDGVDGKPGEPGAPGKDGIYYKPNTETGNFDIVDAEGNVKDSGISWKLSAVTGVMDSNVLTLYGIPNKEGVVNPAGVVINLNSRLRGLVFAGDKCVDGEYSTTYATDAAGLPLLRIGAFYFDGKKLTDKDSNKEFGATDKTDAKDKKYNNNNNTDSIGYKTYAYYHVNPSNVNVEDLKKLSFYVQPNNELSTRAAAVDFKAAAEFVNYDSENGIVKVLVKPEGFPATENKVSTIKLQSTLDDNAVVTSDAATLKKEDIKNIGLADKKRAAATPAVDWHFRQASTVASNGTKGISAHFYPVPQTYTYAVVWDIDDAHVNEGKDIELAINETIDLNDIVGLHKWDDANFTGDEAMAMDELGLSVSYEVVKNFKRGTNNTDQADFITLNGSKITPKVFSTEGNAAVGRTPIIRATLKTEAGRVVDYYYIKVMIVKEKVVVEDKTAEITVGEFKYACDNQKQTTTVEQMNVNLYNKVGLSYDDFYAKYTTVTVNPTGDDFKANVGTVSVVDDNQSGVQTKLLEWTLTPAELWANAGKTIEHKVVYAAADHNLILTLKATVSTEGVVKAKDFVAADRIAEYWKNGKAQFNVAVPAQDDKVSAHCTFVNDLNSPFVTKNGKLNLGEGTTYNYFFCKDNEGETTVGGVKAKFTVSEDGLTLNAASAKDNGWNDAVAILVINNSSDAVPFNTVTVQENDFAKELLNTGALEAKFGVKANTCFTATDEISNEVEVTFEGVDHFTALFLRPITIANNSAKNFEDGVNFGLAGSWIKMTDLINPSDWRSYSFTGKNDFLWDYYGISDVEVLEGAQCNLNGTRQALPATIKIEQTDAATGLIESYDKDNNSVAPENSHNLGFLTYKNNGTTVNKDFELYVKVKVTYKWGVVNSGEITIPVKKTVGPSTGE